MNQRVKRAIAAAMSLTMLATATPVSPLYNAIQNAVSSAMIQANAGGLDTWEDIGESGLEWAIEINILKIRVKDGVLSGVAMPNWTSASDVPWDSVKDSIEIVEITGDVTSIGEYAFSQTNKLNTVRFFENSQLETIGAHAFDSCSSLTSVEIPSSVETIGDNAFYKCSSLTSINIPDSVTTIGAGAFYNCSSLTSITIPDSVKTIGYSAFSNCTGLTDTEIGNKVESIGRNAFYNCSKLTSITIPDSVKTIGDSVFTYCTNLSSITAPCTIKAKEEDWKKCNATVSYNHIIETGETKCACEEASRFGDNLYYTLADNKLTIGLVNPNETDKNKNAMPKWSLGDDVPWDNQRGSITSVEIGKGVTSIGAHAFECCSSLTSITIPDSVTSIGNPAFGYCSSLENITIPDSVTVIGTEEFWGCTSLKNITAPCTLKESVETLKEECSATVTYTHPIKTGETQCSCKEASRFGDNLYYTLDEATGKLTIGLINPNETDKNKNAMPEWVSLADVPWYSVKDSIKSVEIGKGVTHIGDYAFYSCSALTAVTIPESVESIGVLAFSECENLTELTFKGAKPSTENGAQAFKDVVNKNAQSVDDFPILHYPKGDKSWDDFLAVNVTNGALNWEGGCFKPEAYIPWNKIEDTNLQWAIDEGKLTIDLIEENGTDNAMPDWLLGFNVPWYSVKDSIKSVEIEKGVTHIGSLAFGTCTILPDITIPDSVTSIGKSAFLGCTKLSSITAPCTLMSSEETWKKSCSATVTYTHPIKTGETQCSCKEASRFGDNLYYTLDEATGKLTIGLINPNETDKNKNAMPEWAQDTDTPWYSEKGNIKFVEIKDGVTKIGSYAFKGCSNLTSIALPASLTIIGTRAFYECTSLTDIVIPASVKTIGTGIFNNCKNLKSVKFAEASQLESIEAGTFSSCQNLSDITIPASVESIANNAFLKCTSLTDIVIPASVTTIGTGIFSNCEKLESVKFAEASQLKSIEVGTFNNCKKLSDITIPASVTTIGVYAFSGCTGLTSIKFEGNVPDMDNTMGDDYDAFTNVGTTTSVKLIYPQDNSTWETFLETAKSEGKIDANGVLSWEGGKFTAEPYLNWNDIAGTALRWTISANGTLYIDKQENAEAGGNFDVPAFGDNAPWKDSINKIRFVDISSSVIGVSASSFIDFNGQAVLVLDADYEGTLPTAPVEGSNYDSLGGGQFIYSKSQLTGASLSLAGKIGVNLSFYITEKNPTIIINDKEINLEDCTIKNGVYTYTLEVAPKDAYDDITFEVKKDSETIIAEYSYSVKSQYVDVVLADTEHKKYNKKVFDMVSALDTYINSSRIYFNEVGENEAAAIKKEIDDALASLGLSGLDEYAPTIARESVEGVEYYGSSLILDSGVKLRHYIEIADYDNVKENIVIKLNDNAVENVVLEKASFTSNSHDVYYFETDEFNPEDFGTNVSVIYEDTAATSGAKKVIDNYSVLTFISLSLGNPETAAKELGTTCKSIYNYYLAADNYNKN